jgi:hypothetical protein
MFVPPNEMFAPPHTTIVSAVAKKRLAMLKKMTNQIYPTTVRCRDREARAAMSSMDRRIRDFLRGKTNGEDVLSELYDHVLDEPVPERLRAMLRR